MFALVALVGFAAGPPIGDELVARIRDREIRELSGMVASRRHPGIFWVHNDSGNKARIFAVKLDGTVVARFDVAAANVDWEDIATDDDGHLYIGDLGDNLRRLPIHVIYRLDEPDPNAPGRPQPLKAVAFAFRYPQGKSYDAESLIVEGFRATIITKAARDEPTMVFSVSLEKPSGIFAPLTAEKTGELKGIEFPATGADLSDDGKRLAICTIGELLVYDREGEASWRLIARLPSPPGQIESIAWAGLDLVVATEEGVISRVNEKTWRKKAVAR